MAEEVEIGNVGGADGVASEVTLQKLLDAVLKQGIGGSGGAGKLQKMHNDALKQGVTAAKDQTKAQKDGTEATKQATESTIKLSRIMQGALLGSLSAVAGSIKGLAGEVLKGSENLGDFAKHLPLVGGYLAPLVGLLDQNVEAFRNMATIGATFGDGLNDIRRISAEAGVPLGEFQELVMENAGAMKLFGGTTASGAKNFARMSKEFREGPGQELMMLGFSAQQLNQTLIEYSEFSQTQIGVDRRNRSIDGAQAAEYAKTLQNVAALTGKRADQIAAEMKAAQSDQRTRLALNQMESGVREKFMANMSQAPEGLQKTLTNLALGIPDELGVQLGSLSDTFREKGHQIKDMSPDEMNDFLAQVGRELDTAGASFGSAGGLVLDGALGDALQIAASLKDKRQLTEEEKKERAAALKQEKETNAGMKKFHDAMRQLSTGVMAAFAAEGGPLEMLTNSMGDLTGMITDFVASPEFKEGMKTLTQSLKNGVTHVKDFFADIQEFGFGTALSNLLEKINFPNIFAKVGDAIGSALKSVFTDPLVLGAIAAIFAGPKILSAASSGVTKMFSGLLGGGGGGGGGGAAPRAAPRGKPGAGGARAGASVGNFVGQMGAGVMKGAAAGLKAFANPAILVGAGILAASITAIGAGIAGATWIIGASLPKFAEGMEKFEEVDGPALVAAAKGMLAISGAMVAFGAGSAVSGLGQLVGGITEGLAGLFGADDPLTKMKKFSDANLDATKVEANAKALVAYSTAMAAYGGGAAAAGLGTLVGGIATGITSFFGGDTEIPFDKIAKFGTYNIDLAGVENNAKALVAYSNAMAKYSAGSAGASIMGAVGSVFDAVSGFFGGEKEELPFDKIKAFASVDLGDTEKIKGNADAVAAFGNAMSSLPANLDGERSGGLMGAVAGFFKGEQKLPYDRIKEFADVDLGDTAKVKSNAEAVSAFGTAMSNLPANIDGERSGGLFGALATAFGGGKKLPYDNIKAFSTADLGSLQGVQNNANVVSAFSTAFSGLNDVEIDKVTDYAEALDTLTESLKDLNKELKRDNDSLLTERADAGELLSGISTASSGSSEGINRLNSTMQSIETILGQINTHNENTAKYTKGMANADGLTFT